LILKLIDMAHALYEQDNVSLWASNSIVWCLFTYST
jgi:hypothetical protein